MIAVPSLLSGCVVTDPIEFDQPVNNPPMFVDRPGSQLNVAALKWVANDDPAAPSWPFRFRVRESDLTQQLEAHWRIVLDGNTNPDRKDTIQIPPTRTGSLTRDFEIVINNTDLVADNCHRIDVAVSGSFEQPAPGDPEDRSQFDNRTERDDIARFTFWIWEGDPDNADYQKLIETCRAETVVPPTVPTGGAGESGL